MSASDLNWTGCKQDVFIVGALRTPIGRYFGVLSGMPAHALGAAVLRQLLNITSEDNVELKEYILSRLDEVIVGQVFTAGAGQNPARQAAVLAGIPYSVPAWGVNMLCGSGLKAVCLAYDRLKCSSADLGGWIIAGGQESMSQTPQVIPMERDPKHSGSAAGMDDSCRPIRTLIHDGLTDAFCGKLMGFTIEMIAKKYGITREQQDRFAARSQAKYASAEQAGIFNTEIVPILVTKGNATMEMCIKDEFPRPNTTVEVLECLKSAFCDASGYGTVTSGNASGVTDGAAFVLLCRADQLFHLGSHKPLARIAGWHQVGLEPELMGIAPARAIRELLSKLQWNLDSVHVFEVNEAFAAQILAVVKELNLPMDRLNMYGGAIALGHPFGCSGARVLVTLAHALHRLSQSKTVDRCEPVRGVAALCIGGGMGIAIALEACS